MVNNRVNNCINSVNNSINNSVESVNNSVNSIYILPVPSVVLNVTEENCVVFDSRL